ncbi:hypothetical protein PT2222_30174 [Paraburkholderia tropica]
MSRRGHRSFSKCFQAVPNDFRQLTQVNTPVGIGKNPCLRVGGFIDSIRGSLIEPGPPSRREMQ